MYIESVMSYYPTSFVFGNGATDNSTTVVNQATYAGEINQTFTYHVMDCPSPYNAILGRL